MRAETQGDRPPVAPYLIVRFAKESAGLLKDWKKAGLRGRQPFELVYMILSRGLVAHGNQGLDQTEVSVRIAGIISKGTIEDRDGTPEVTDTLVYDAQIVQYCWILADLIAVSQFADRLVVSTEFIESKPEGSSQSSPLRRVPSNAQRCV